MSLYLGVDIGTYESKGAVVDADGRIVAQAVHRHGLMVPQAGWAEHDAERDWWGDESDGFRSRVETEQAWRVPAEQIKANGYNLDLKNPHNPDTGPGDVDHLLPDYEKLLAKIADTRVKLKRELEHALTRPPATVGVS